MRSASTRVRRGSRGVVAWLITTARIVGNGLVIKMFPKAIVFGILLLVVTPAYALDAKTAVRCLMGEARGESFECQVATAEVIRRRNSTQGIYGCKAEFKEPAWVWDRAKKAWAASESTDLSKGATHFESTSFKTPYWASNMVLVARVGKHNFYKEK